MMMKKLFFVVLVSLVVGISLYSCKDMGDQPAKPLLTANSLSVTLSPGGQTTLTISGGNPPYTISRGPDTSIAKATLVGSSLTLQATSANISGTTSVKIMDTDPSNAYDSPTHEEQEIEIAIRVSSVLVSFSSQVQPIFTASCVNAGCHPGNGAPFSLVAGAGHTNLVGPDMLNGMCGGKRVVAGNANASGLVKKLEGNCGDRMPLGGAPLSPAQIALIRDWINQGALNN